MPASFRNVDFFINSSDDEMGRRTVVHEFPIRQNPYVEDMGFITRKIAFSAYVIGKDYFDKRTALENALNEKGSGTLIHPYYGSILVVLSSPVKVQHTAENGGMCIFTLEFVRVDSDSKSQVSAKPNIAHQLTQKSNSLFDKIEAKLAKALQLDGMIAHVHDKVMGFAGDCLTRFENTAAVVTKPLTEIQNMAHANTGLAHSFVDSFRSAGEQKSPQTYLAATKELPKIEVPDFAGTSTLAIKKSEKALETATKELCVVSCMQSLVNYIPETRQEAKSIRKNLVFLLDELSFDANDEFFQKLIELRVLAMRQLAENLGKVPQVLMVTHQKQRTALDTAWFYFANIDAESNMASRNDIEHPGFLPAGVNIEVVNNA